MPHLLLPAGATMTETVYCCFDDSNVGLKRHKQCLSEPSRLLQSTAIYVVEENVGNVVFVGSFLEIGLGVHHS